MGHKFDWRDFTKQYFAVYFTQKLFETTNWIHLRSFKATFCIGSIIFRWYTCLLSSNFIINHFLVPGCKSTGPIDSLLCVRPSVRPSVRHRLSWKPFDEIFWNLVCRCLLVNENSPQSLIYFTCFLCVFCFLIAIL